MKKFEKTLSAINASSHTCAFRRFKQTVAKKAESMTKNATIPAPFGYEGEGLNKELKLPRATIL